MYSLSSGSETAVKISFSKTLNFPFACIMATLMPTFLPWKFKSTSNIKMFYVFYLVMEMFRRKDKSLIHFSVRFVKQIWFPFDFQV